MEGTGLVQRHAAGLQLGVHLGSAAVVLQVESRWRHRVHHGRPARISREGILAEARKIPPGKLTLSLLAKRLGVAPTALYHRFRARDDLFAALSDDLVDDFPVPAVDARQWRRWLIVTAVDLHRYLLAHPIAFESRSAQLFLRSGVRLGEAALATLEGAGFSPEDAFVVWGAVSSYVFVAARNSHEAPKLKLDVEQRTKQLRSLPPHVQALFARLSTRRPEGIFVDLVKRLVNNIQSPARA